METDDEGRASFLVPSSIARVRVGFDAEHVSELALGGGGEVLRVELSDG